MTRLMQTCLTAAVVACLGLVSPSIGADEKPLQEQMVDAYKGIKTYQATTSFTVEQKSGRMSQKQTTDFHVALDKEAGKLVIDKPNMRLVVDGGKLLLNSEEIKGRHLETKAPLPLDYGSLLGAMPFLGRPVLPDLALALSKDPLASFGEGKDTKIEALPADAQGRPGVQISGKGTNTMVLWLDPKTHLATKVTLSIDGAAGGAPGQSIALTYDIKIEKHNEPLAADTFAFDTTGSKAVATLQDFVGAEAAGGGEGAHPLEGKAAPPVDVKTIDGKDFSLKDAKAKVVILDFWATWCPPCRKGLPELEKIKGWAEKEKKDVTIYAVNLRETAEQVNEFWKAQKLTLNVLMDDGKVAEAYGVSGIPQTVLIRNGKIEKIYVGLRDDMEATLKTDIDALLAEAPAPAAAK